MKFGCSFGVFLNSAHLICRNTDISKCFSGSLRLRDNESRLYSRAYKSGRVCFYNAVMHPRDADERTLTAEHCLHRTICSNTLGKDYSTKILQKILQKIQFYRKFCRKFFCRIFVLLTLPGKFGQVSRTNILQEILQNFLLNIRSADLTRIFCRIFVLLT